MRPIVRWKKYSCDRDSADSRRAPSLILSLKNNGRRSAAVIIFGTAAFLLMLGLRVLAQTEDRSSQEPFKTAQVAAPVQPIPFSHKNHLAFGLKCDLCHANPDPGINVAFPSTAQCMVCHITVVKDSPDIQKLAQFDKSKS